ncbi:hypothetical protein GTR04_7577 [Trichophyton interdigitale]|nr:hypothetical protein GY631_7573 [Trichophyton interdigitale]KAG8205041.1 hypothetical protein GTR04_7577 [Trichophyton interdigitale]
MARRSPKSRLCATSVPRNRHRERAQQADIIDRYGSPVEFPCSSCFSSGALCIIMDSKSKKCSGCVRSGQPCLDRVFSAAEWQKIKDEEDRVASRLRARDCDLRIVQDELRRLQIALARCQNVLSEKLDDHAQLRRRQEQLKARRLTMFSHDASILDSSDSGVAASSGPSFPGLTLEQLLEAFGGDIPQSPESRFEGSL